MNSRLGTPTVLVLILMSSFAGLSANLPWQQELHNQLPLLGHRNWIVVADSAYPWQTAAGIETLYADADQVQVVEAVLGELAKVRHVKPTIYTDAELKYVSEQNAPGISAYRQRLEKLLKRRPVQVLPHNDIITQLDAAGQKFRVLLIKTKLTLPYTSVFFQLECGYWNEEAEKQLRDAMKTK